MKSRINNETTIKSKIIKDWYPIIFILIFDFLAILILVYISKFEQIPTTLLSSIAVAFSAYAYKFSKEKFRLDLLDRRWEIYEQVLKFCSVAVTHGGLPKRSEDESINQSVISGLEAAHESFRGIGIHKTKSLFGPEVHEKFEQLNKMYAWFVTRPRTEDWVEREHQYLGDILKIIEELPVIFRPYIYFGDYKD